MTKVLVQFYSTLLLCCAYFCLWAISYYLLGEVDLAWIFLPSALRLGVSLHSQARYWLASYLAEWLILGLLSWIFNVATFSLILLSLISLLILVYLKPFYYGSQSRRLAIQGCLSVGMSGLTAFMMLAFNGDFWTSWLISCCGMMLILPACLLLYEFLFNTQWIALTSQFVHKPVVLRAKPILLYSCLFLGNVYIQTMLPASFGQFALFCLAIPIILLAWHYDWKGALLGTLLNSIALIATSPPSQSQAINDLLLLLIAQTITGILLGLAMQRQRQLNHHLSEALNRNQQLTRQLIYGEETVRKAISQDLHDEIGQNITAIRTQASILKRLDSSAKVQNVSQMIEQLSLNIYDTTKHLLNRIRPRLLDDISLQQALKHLFLELNLESHQIQAQLFWQVEGNEQLDPALEMTLYRLCQEALNNTVKYAQASNVIIRVELGREIKLSIEDDGKGFEVAKVKKGLGIQGMYERVHLLGGSFKLTSCPQTENAAWHGTRIEVQLVRF